MRTHTRNAETECDHCSVYGRQGLLRAGPAAVLRCGGGPSLGPDSHGKTPSRSQAPRTAQAPRQLTQTPSHWPIRPKSSAVRCRRTAERRCCCRCWASGAAERKQHCCGWNQCSEKAAAVPQHCCCWSQVFGESHCCPAPAEAEAGKGGRDWTVQTGFRWI